MHSNVSAMTLLHVDKKWFFKPGDLSRQVSNGRERFSPMGKRMETELDICVPQ